MRHSYFGPKKTYLRRSPLNTSAPLRLYFTLNESMRAHTEECPTIWAYDFNIKAIQ